jgi:hypothetical protein
VSENGTPPDFEFSEQELATRPRSIVAIYGGPTWSVIEEAEDIAEAQEAAKATDSLFMLNACQDELPPTLIWVSPHLIATIFQVTEDRWKADRIAGLAREEAMRQQAASSAMHLARPGG